jgi:hypothetical protein
MRLLPEAVGLMTPSSHGSLTLADALQALRQDIQAEHTLIASRITWYVTSQAFLLTAYATSWTAHFQWPFFFHRVLPVAGVVLSIVIYVSVYAATWAQDVYLREQTALVKRIKAEVALAPEEIDALLTYERTMVGNRRNAVGHAIGQRIHALVRLTPLLLPVGFAGLWLFAFYFAPFTGD